ncbi:hypothetical protein WJ41_13825 [Burkholderia ubonensis]|uniref:transglutaminase domain-containing protein n=1 Tax=Burkholderia ubonensis TaxID=101571 RepID=UPI0007532B87|nr:transglutaminase domain-containing protein [Burkholderia ubonensis]KVH72206.1 hypothetical protein WJ41_13825 [Burkholderia ubonensis]KVU04724.1 hypothetical protein WK61_02385 [Burkholderia ubonensis]
MADTLSFLRHSVITDPGAYACWFDSLPDDLARIPETLAGFLVNYETDRHLIDDDLIARRGGEIDLRWVSSIMRRAIELDASPLAVARQPDRRVLCTCRDTAVLLCSILRHRAIPARVRFGFHHYLYRSNLPPHDHVIVEYFRDGRWRYLESRFSPSFEERCNLFGIPPDNFPPELFWPASEAWRRIRSGESSAGAYAGVGADAKQGLRRVRSQVLADMASLSGYEPLIWDSFGPALEAPPDVDIDNVRQLRELDMLASLDTDGQIAWMRDHGIRLLSPGDRIVSFSPVRGLYRTEAGPATEQTSATGLEMSR